MAIRIEIPSALRLHACGSAVVVIEQPCASVSDALDALASQCPGVVDRVRTEQGELREHVNVFVDEENSRFSGGLGAPVAPGSTIMILAAISGG
ncbi:MAG: MoaD/ThiS family protein [Gemmatimonadaceae bacterium]